MSWAPLVLPTLLLLAGVITDVRSRKVYNWMVIAGFILALVQVLYFSGVAGLAPAVMAALLGMILTLPLVLIGVLGAGDMKLLMAFGMATSYAAVISVTLYSFVWAAVFGLIHAILSKQIVSVGRNMLALSRGQKPDAVTLHKIPFTVAMAVAWGTFVLSLKGGL